MKQHWWSDRAGIAALLAFALVTLLAFYNLAAPDIQFWDEATNAQVVVESAQAGDWWNLRYQGDYFWEKPPLYYWAGVIGYKLAPGLDPLLILRGLTALGTLLLAGSVAVWLGKRRALVWLLLLAACPALWLFSNTGVLATHNFRSADGDVWQILFIVWGWLAVSAWNPSKNSYKTAALVGLLSGLAWLIKGPLGALPLVLIFCKLSLLVYRKEIALKVWFLNLALAGSSWLAVILPWHLAMLFAFGDKFWQQYFLYHQLSRATSSLEGHIQPWSFFLGLLANPLYSGSLLIGTALAVSFSFAQTARDLAKKLLNIPELMVAFGLLILFSAAGTKLSWYILPALVFALLGLTRLLSQLLPKNKNLATIFKIALLQLACMGVVILIQLAGYKSSISGLDVRGSRYFTERENHRVFKLLELTQDFKPYERGRSVLVDINENPDLSRLKITSVEFLSPNYAKLEVESKN
jgi:4-amino-4-deoxy-L-arabinose transferase-like glycosyltransferase